MSNRDERLRLIAEVIGPELLRNDPVVATHYSIIYYRNAVDIDQGMASLCRDLATRLQEVLQILRDRSVLSNPLPIVINGIGMSAKVMDHFEPGDTAYWNDKFELVKHKP